mgnify:CR=1 FL=1
MSSSDDSSTAEAREAALRLLARREHSAAELKTKLVGKGWPEDHVDQIIPALAEAGLQSDRRFAESFARQRAGRFYGPRRIQAELAQRGIDSGLAHAALESLGVDFADLAADFYRRKYGKPAERDSGPGRGSGPAPLDFRERAKRSQAMYRRGFESEHLRGLL